jgi:hypothetical protein
LSIVDRAKKNEDEVEAMFKAGATYDERERLEREQKKLMAELEKLGERTDVVSGLIVGFLRRSNIVDRFLAYFEVSFPCSLVFALACLFIYMRAINIFGPCY